MPRWLVLAVISGCVVIAGLLTLRLFGNGEDVPSPIAGPVRSDAPSGPPSESDAPPDPRQEAEAIKAEAIAAAERAAATYPDDGLTHALLGAAFYNIGRSSDAVRHLERCLQLRPQQTDAYEILARIAYEKGDPEQAIRLGREALARGAASMEVLHQLGRALMDLGRTSESIETLQRAAALRSATSETHYLLGQARLQSGDHTNAIIALERATELMPEHTQAAYALYVAHARLGASEAAARHRARFEHLEKADRAALVRRNSSEEALSGLILVRESAARTLFGASQIHRLHGDPERAIELLRRCVELHPENRVYAAALKSLRAPSATSE